MVTPIPDPDLTGVLDDDDHALTLLSQAFRDTQETRTRIDPMAQGLYAGWLAGRASELTELRDSPELAGHPEVRRVIQSRLDVLAVSGG